MKKLLLLSLIGVSQIAKPVSTQQIIGGLIIAGGAANSIYAQYKNYGINKKITAIRTQLQNTALNKMQQTQLTHELNILIAQAHKNNAMTILSLATFFFGYGALKTPIFTPAPSPTCDPIPTQPNDNEYTNADHITQQEPTNNLYAQNEPNEENDLAIAQLLSQDLPSVSSSQENQAQAITNYLQEQSDHIAHLLNTPTNTTPPQYTVLGNIGQTDNTCGSYAIINAKAIQNLFDRNQEISTENLRAETYAILRAEDNRYQNLCTLQNASFDELNPLMRALAIPIFSADRQNNQRFFISNALEDDTSERFLDFVNRIENRQETIGHFVINTGGHWMLLSVVQRDGDEPRIYCVDTANTEGNPIPQNCRQYQFITCIWNILEREPNHQAQENTHIAEENRITQEAEQLAAQSIEEAVAPTSTAEHMRHLRLQAAMARRQASPINK